MTRAFHPAVLLTTALAAVACGESSPTAPSAVDPTSPVATAMTAPMPAPVSQTLTGTWTGSGQTFTVTQNGNSATGMIAPTTTAVGNGTTLTGSTTITGTVADVNVSLQLADRMIVRGAGTTTTCTAGHAFIGTLAGNTLSGVMTGTTPLSCNGDVPAVAVPEVLGPVVYIRH